MLTIRRGVLALVVVLLLLTGCHRPSDGVVVADGVVATVDDVPITAAYVNSLVDREGRSTLLVDDRPHPFRAGLDLAIRDQLLVLEADRRGLDGRTRAELLAALVEQEAGSLKELDVATISDVEARTWYVENRELFDEVSSAQVAWARFKKRETARAAFDELAGSDAQAFARQVQRLPTAGSYGSEDISEGDGTEYILLRLANAVRRSGVVCLDRDSESGDWWLVHVESVALEPTPWNAKFSTEVKGAMTYLREERHLQSVADQAHKQWPVRIYEEQAQELTR